LKMDIRVSRGIIGLPGKKFRFFQLYSIATVEDNIYIQCVCVCVKIECVMKGVVLAWEKSNKGVMAKHNSSKKKKTMGFPH